MNEPAKRQTAKIQRIEVEQVNCFNCFYLDSRHFCIRNRFPVLNPDEACKHFLFEKRGDLNGK